MSTADLPLVEGQRSGEDLKDYVNRLANLVALMRDELEFVVNGNIDTRNIRRIKYDFGGGVYLLIDRTGITLNDGTEDTFRADTAGDVNIKGIITALAGLIGGWTIQGNALYSSVDSYPRVVMDPENNEMVFYGSATEYIKFGAFSNANRPYMEFFNGLATMRIDLSATQWEFGPNGVSVDVRINAGSTKDLLLEGKNVYISPSAGGSAFVDFGSLVDPISLTDLDTELDGKANTEDAANYMVYDSATTELKLYSIDGILLSTVNIP